MFILTVLFLFPVSAADPGTPPRILVPICTPEGLKCNQVVPCAPRSKGCAPRPIARLPRRFTGVWK